MRVLAIGTRQRPIPSLDLPMSTPVPTRGARVQAIRAGRVHELVLETYAREEGSRRWIWSADSQHARLLERFEVERIPPQLEPAQPAPLVLQARAHLEGGRISAFETVEGQWAALTVDSGQGAWRLISELVHHDANVFLVDPQGRLVGAMRPIAPGRGLALGEAYGPDARVPRPLGEPARVPPPDPNQAQELDRIWSVRMVQHDLETLRVQGARVLRDAIKRLERRRFKLDADRATGLQADAYRHWGDLLKIHGAAWRAGLPELRVPDEFSEGRPEVAIPLDPALNLAENIAHLFHRYRKSKNSLEHVSRRIADTEKELDTLRARLAVIMEAATLESMEKALGEAARSQPNKNAGTAKSSMSGRGRVSAGYFERISSDGLSILIGRSAAENDVLTFRVARGRDWWFHALGRSGAHVVVRNDSGGPLPQATLREAAWLAGHYSKARKEGQVEVAYAERQHVRRVRGGPPGAVTYAQGRTLWVNLEDEKLQGVLGKTADTQGTN
jgi:predicted ribosome quality control (RQC) complex YloA/Tae2 family protein